MTCRIHRRKGPTRVTATTYAQVDDDHEVEITATASVSPYDPGRIEGPVEQCYPPEGGEVEFDEILAGKCMTFDESTFALLFGEAALERLREAAFELAQEA